MKHILFISLALIALFTSCDNDDSFSSNPSLTLSFEKSTIDMDTVFANTLSAYKEIMIHNNAGDGLRISSVRQVKGADKTGFMVNVNGSYIDPEQNNQVTDLEVRNDDSIRVWVEFKPKALLEEEDIKTIEDDVVFTYESGTQQTLHITGKAWNANVLNDYHAKGTDEHLKDIEGMVQGRPYVIYGNLTVDEGAKLTLEAGDTLYFHQGPKTNAGLEVKGTLIVAGNKDNGVLLRCDRLDSLLQLKYDNVPGKWAGVHFYPSTLHSTLSTLSYMELHGSDYGIICDTTKVAIDHSTIHNIAGVGIQSINSTLTMSDVQLSNARDNCLYIQGGDVSVNSSTIASFYAYSEGRQNAIVFTDVDSLGNLSPLSLKVQNTIITGYNDDEVWYSPFKADSTATDINFDYCLLRTVQPTGANEGMATNSIFEDIEDEGGGQGNFVTFDTYNFYYDFTPKSTSKAVGKANDTAATDDRKGNPRKSPADIGAFESSASEK